MPSRSLPRAIALAILAFASVLHPVSAQDGWLDNPLVPWNEPGMPIPSAPPDGLTNIDALCSRTVRPPETPEDEAMVRQGWALFGTYQGGWGLRLVGATSGFDGMCRPMGYQYFIFWQGTFAGTLSPVPMASRATGAGRILSVDSEGRVIANFTRYAASDPLCCPSRPGLAVEFRIHETAAGPTLVPERVYEFN
jgi:hypothetical protein